MFALLFRLIWPSLMGHRPEKSSELQGSMVVEYTFNPYAKTISSMVMLPLTVLTPLTSKAILWLSAVKTTSKRVAEKLLFSWQGLRELEVSMRSAHANGATSSSREDITYDIDGFMAAVATASVVGGCVADRCRRGWCGSPPASAKRGVRRRRATAEASR